MNISTIECVNIFDISKFSSHEYDNDKCTSIDFKCILIQIESILLSCESDGNNCVIFSFTFHLPVITFLPTGSKI